MLDSTLIRLHRVGRFSRNRTPPIIVRFHHYKDRYLVWEYRKLIHSQEQIHISKNYPVVIAEHRRRLFPIMSNVYMYQDPTNHDFRYTGHVAMDKLILMEKGTALTYCH